MSLTPAQFKALFPNASKHTIANNIGGNGAIHVSRETQETVPQAGGAASPRDPVPGAKPKSRSRKRLQATLLRATENSARYFIRIESRRLYLTDEDNLCAKYHLDALRYAGAIRDDAPNAIKLEVFQTQVLTSEEEITIIEIFPPGHWPEGVK